MSDVLYKKFLDAIKKNSVSEVKDCIELGVDIHQIQYSEDALHVAIEHSDDPEIVQTLLEAGADPNSVGSGMTALHHAFDITFLMWQDIEGYSDFRVIELLIDYGADPEKPSPAGGSVYDFVNRYHFSEGVELLNRGGRTPPFVYAPIPILEPEPPKFDALRFYDDLGDEDSSRPCKRKSCKRGSIKVSSFCRIHHFEMVIKEPSPYTH